jgi:NO-binding membrane sensor protein with MHYT domain
VSEDSGDDVDLQPLDVDGVGAVAVGTVVWAVAFVVCLLLQGRLDAAGNGWWTWVCAAGALLGLPGLWYVRRRRDAYRRAAAAAVTD